MNELMKENEITKQKAPIRDDRRFSSVDATVVSYIFSKTLNEIVVHVQLKLIDWALL